MRRTLSISDGPRIATLAVVLAVTLLLSACSGWSFDVTDEIIGSGDVVTEQRNVDGFEIIDFRAFGTMIIEEGNRDALTVREIKAPRLAAVTASRVNGLFIGTAPFVDGAVYFPVFPFFHRSSCCAGRQQ